MLRNLKRTAIVVVAVLLIAQVAPAHSSRHWQTAADLIAIGEKQQTSDMNTAVQSFRSALQIARESGDHSLTATILLKLSAAYLHSREHSKSLASADESLEESRRAGDRKLEAWAHDQAGNALYEMGRFSDALERFETSVALMRDVGDRFGEAIALKDAGILSKYLRRYDRSFIDLSEALTIFREINDHAGVISTLHNIGIAYDAVGASRLALEAYEEALKVSREIDDRTGACHVLVRLGYLVRNQQLALQYLTEALKLAEELNLYDLQVESLNGLSSLFGETGQLDEAIQAQEGSLKLNRQWNRREATELTGLGYLYLKRTPERAIGYFRDALAASRRESDSPLNFSPHHGLATAFRLLGDLNGAIEHYRIAIESLESVRTKLSSKQHRASFAGKHQHIYNGLIETLLELHEKDKQAGYDRQAFEVLERARARSLLEALAEARMDSQKDEDQQQRLAELNARIAALQSRLIQPGATSEDRAGSKEELSRLEQEFDRVTSRVEQEFEIPLAKPLSVDAAQHSLDDRTAIVSYLITTDRLILFSLTRETFSAESLSLTQSQISTLIENYLDLIDRDDKQGWQAVSKRLYDGLVAPARENLSPAIDRLIVIPDGALHYLPFETLLVHDPLSNNKVPEEAFLIQHLAVSYAPSVTMLNQLNKEQTTSTQQRSEIIVFADPELDAGLLESKSAFGQGSIGRSLFIEEGLKVAPIPYSGDEALVIKRYLGNSSTLFTGNEASERRVKDEHLDQFRILHFATHGLISPQVPGRSALLLASGANEDGLLQVREIFQMKLDSDLVVLSACETARGQVLAGEGVRGLAHAFFHAGARSVVASLWSVNDQRTTTLMEAFYKNLAEHKSKSEALRAAKLEMLKSSATSSPRYWGAFILLGEANTTIPVSGSSDLIWWWVIPAVGVAVVIGYGFRRRKHQRARR